MDVNWDPTSIVGMVQNKEQGNQLFKSLDIQVEVSLT